MSPHRVLRPFFALLAVSALISLPQPDPAHASDCGSFGGVCVDEVLTTNGTSRILTIRLTAGADGSDHFNVIVPGQGQTEWKYGSVLRLAVQPDGTVTYSAQGCYKNYLKSNCNPWRQVTRHFAPLNACQDYANAAIAAVGGSDTLGCGFGGAGRWDHNAQTHLNACLMFVGDWQGFIRNETNLRANDLAACKQRIAAANKPVTPSKPIKTTSKAGSGGSAGAGVAVLSCRGGGSMKVTLSGPTSVFVAFMPATQTANSAPPGPGECAWPDRLAAPNEANRFAFDPSRPNGQQLLQAVKGGTFQLTANPVGTFIMVHEINNVQVVDSTPLSPAPVGGGGAGGGGGGAPLKPADMGGAPPIQADVSCGAPGATATVVIPEPNLTELNVRSKPDGSILGTVPKGAQVTLGGRCGSGTAAGIIKPAEPTGGAAGWCQIRQPLAGCVMAKYLDFSGGGTAAGFAKPRR